MRPFPTTDYFEVVSLRPDRSFIRDEWIAHVIEYPLASEVQSDGRIKLWAAIEEYDGRFLRVILLEDGRTVHNAFFDRRFRGR